MKPLPVAFCCLALSTGCVSSQGILELLPEERAAFGALESRLTENEQFMLETADQLGELGAEYAKLEHELLFAIAKAKLLTSMQAPWDDENAISEARRATILYHLYEIETAEQKALDAIMRERRTAAQELNSSYGKLAALIKGASKNLQVVLKYLNQPKHARILAFTTTFLNEATSFREKLQASQNPRLQQLAEDVARHEARAKKAKELATKALEAFSNTPERE